MATAFDVPANKLIPKLAEELSNDSEQLHPTTHAKIVRLHSEIEVPEISVLLDHLAEHLCDDDSANLKAALFGAVCPDAHQHLDGSIPLRKEADVRRV